MNTKNYRALSRGAIAYQLRPSCHQAAAVYRIANFLCIYVLVCILASSLTCSNDFVVVAECRNWLLFNSIMEPAVVTHTNKVTQYMCIHVCITRRGSGRHVYGRPASSWTRSDVKKTSANMYIDLLAVVAVLLATDIIRRSSNSCALLLPAAQYSIFLMCTPVLDH
jgi:hypothetical protein